jgi:hypothetical protein
MKARIELPDGKESEFVDAARCFSRVETGEIEGWPCASTVTNTFDCPTAFSQLFDQHISVVTLNFNHTLFHRAPGTTLCFKMFPEFFKRQFIKENASNHRHTFPLASFRFSSNSHNAIAFRNLLFLTAYAF